MAHTVSNIRGSLLLTIDEDYVDNFQVLVNSEERKMHYSDSNNLYTTKLFHQDSVVIILTPLSGKSITAGLIRRNYTTDDVVGDRGISDDTINVDQTYVGSVLYINFMVYCPYTNYNFEYILETELDSYVYCVTSGATAVDACEFIPDCDVTPVPSPTPITSQCVVFAVDSSNDIYVYEPSTGALTFILSVPSGYTPYSILDIANNDNKLWLNAGNRKIIEYDMVLYPFSLTFNRIMETGEAWTNLGSGLTQKRNDPETGNYSLIASDGVKIMEHSFHEGETVMTSSDLFSLASGNYVTGDFLYNQTNDHIIVVHFESTTGGTINYLTEYDATGNIVTQMSGVPSNIFGLYEYNNDIYCVRGNGAIYKVIGNLVSLEYVSNMGISAFGTSQKLVCIDSAIPTPSATPTPLPTRTPTASITPSPTTIAIGTEYCYRREHLAIYIQDDYTQWDDSFVVYGNLTGGTSTIHFDNNYDCDCFTGTTILEVYNAVVCDPTVTPTPTPTSTPTSTGTPTPTPTNAPAPTTEPSPSATPTPTPTPPTYHMLLYSSVGFTTSTAACANDVVALTGYSDVVVSQLINHIIYEDAALTIPIDGENKWWTIADPAYYEGTYYAAGINTAGLVRFFLECDPP